MDFDMFFGILMFGPRGGFCMMADFYQFENGRIFCLLAFFALVFCKEGR